MEDELFLELDIDLLDAISIYEMGAPKVEDAITNQMQHMIKYICSRKQTPSWVQSILNGYLVLVNEKNIAYIDSKLDDLYHQALLNAKKEGNTIPSILENRPNDWTYENLSDIEFIRQFLTNYYKAIYPFDIDKLIDGKLKNLKNKKKKK